MRKSPGDLQRKATQVMFEICGTVRQELMSFGAQQARTLWLGRKQQRAVGADRPRSNGSERPHPPDGFRRDIRRARSVNSCRSPC